MSFNQNFTFYEIGLIQKQKDVTYLVVIDKNEKKTAEPKLVSTGSFHYNEKSR